MLESLAVLSVSSVPAHRHMDSASSILNLCDKRILESSGLSLSVLTAVGVG